MHIQIAYTHTHTQTHTHRDTYTKTDTDMHTHKHTHARARTRTDTHTRTHTTNRQGSLVCTDRTNHRIPDNPPMPSLSDDFRLDAEDGTGTNAIDSAIFQVPQM